MTKLRVLHIIPSFDVGGAEKVVLTYLQSAVQIFSFEQFLYMQIEIQFITSK